jgi:hypothetical protein
VQLPDNGACNNNDGQQKARGQLIRVGTNRKKQDVLMGVDYFLIRVYVTAP